MRNHEEDRRLHHMIREATADDIEPITWMHVQSWIDTYPNEEFGVSEKWVRERMEKRSMPEAIATRKANYIKRQASGEMQTFVAVDTQGEIIGMTAPYIDDHDGYHLGALYVAKGFQGTGVASELMQKALDWLGQENDITLGVAVYNERAKAFYRKWGFQEIPGSERMFDGKIPEIGMIRKGERS